MEHVLCELCEVDDARPYQQENGYQAVQCRRCGLVYTNPRPSIDEMKELYEGQETQIDLPAHLAERDHKSIQARKCLRRVQHYQPSGRLLEIGSAAGYFLNEARALGYDVQGLDITRQFCDFSRDVLGIPTFEGILRDAPFEDGAFDVIYHRNVLSHLAYPREEFAIMNRLLAPGGVVIFETGNVAELSAERAGFLELPDHLYHFSEATMRTLLDQTDFEPLNVHRHMLLSQHPWVRGVKQGIRERLFKRHDEQKVKERKGRVTGGALPDALPPSRLSRRIASRLAQVVRYDIGERLPTHGHRCTLVVVGRKR